MELRLAERCSIIVVIVSVIIKLIDARGRMLEPSQRSSLWRHGFNTPINRDDDGLNCGGYWHQWQVNGGKCGVCGDPYDVLPRDNEAGGKYATGLISRTYDINAKHIDVVIEVKKNMKGYFEFRICPDVRIDKPVTQKCLDEHLLEIIGHGQRFYPEQNGMINLRLLIPTGMTCERCVLQWKWHTAMNWGKCSDGSGSGMGCGDQEEYYNCADIAITSSVSDQNNLPVDVPLPSTIANMRRDSDINSVLSETTSAAYPMSEATAEPILPIFDFHDKGELKKADVDKYVANKMANDQIQVQTDQTSLLSNIDIKDIRKVPKVEGIILPFLGDKPTGAAVGNSSKASTEESTKDSQTNDPNYSFTSNILNRFQASADFGSKHVRTTRSLPDTSTVAVQTAKNSIGSLMGSNVGILTIPGDHATIAKKTASSSGVLSGPGISESSISDKSETSNIEKSTYVVSSISQSKDMVGSMNLGNIKESAINRVTQGRIGSSVRTVQDRVGSLSSGTTKEESLTTESQTQSPGDMQENIQSANMADSAGSMTITHGELGSVHTAKLGMGATNAEKMTGSASSSTDSSTSSAFKSVSNLKNRLSTEEVISTNNEAIPVSNQEISIKSSNSSDPMTSNIETVSTSFNTETPEERSNGSVIQTKHTISITVNHTVTHEGTDQDMPHGPVIDVNRLRKVVDFIENKENSGSKTKSVLVESRNTNDKENGSNTKSVLVQRQSQNFKQEGGSKTKSVTVSARNIFGSKKRKLLVNTFSGAAPGTMKSGQVIKFKVSVGKMPEGAVEERKQSVEVANNQTSTSEKTVVQNNDSGSLDMGIPIPMTNTKSSSTTRVTVETTDSPAISTTTDTESKAEARQQVSIMSNKAVISGVGPMSSAYGASNMQRSLSLSTGLGGTMTIAGGSLSAMHGMTRDVGVGSSQRLSNQSPSQTDIVNSQIKQSTNVEESKAEDIKNQVQSSSNTVNKKVTYTVNKAEIVNPEEVVIQPKEQVASTGSSTETSGSLSSRISSVSSLGSLGQTSQTFNSENEMNKNIKEELSVKGLNMNSAQVKETSSSTLIGNKMATVKQMKPMETSLMKETTIIEKTIAENSQKNNKETKSIIKETVASGGSNKESVSTKSSLIENTKVDISQQIGSNQQEDQINVARPPATLPPQTIPSTFAPTSDPSAFNADTGLTDQLLSKPILIKGSINLGAPNNQWQSIQQEQNIASGMIGNRQAGAISSEGWVTISNSGTGSGTVSNDFQSINPGQTLIDRVNAIQDMAFAQSSSNMATGNSNFIPLPPGEIFAPDPSLQQQPSSFDSIFPGFDLGGSSFGGMNQNALDQGAGGNVLSTFDQTLSQSGLDHTLLVADAPTYDSSYGPLLSSSGKGGIDSSAGFAFVTIPPDTAVKQPVTIKTVATTQAPVVTTTMKETTTLQTTTPTTTPTITEATTAKPTSTTVDVTTPTTAQATTEATTTTAPVAQTRRTTEKTTTIPEMTTVLSTQGTATEKPMEKTTESQTSMAEKNFLQSMFKALTEIMLKVRSEQNQVGTQSSNTITNTNALMSDSQNVMDNSGTNIQMYNEGTNNIQDSSLSSQQNMQTVSTSEAFQQDVRRDRILDTRVASNTNTFNDMSSNANVDMSWQYSNDQTQQSGMSNSGGAFNNEILATERTTSRPLPTTTTMATTTTTKQPVTDAYISGLSGLMPQKGGMSSGRMSMSSGNVETSSGSENYNIGNSGSQTWGFSGSQNFQNSGQSGQGNSGSQSWTSANVIESNSVSRSWSDSGSQNLRGNSMSPSWNDPGNQNIDLMSNIGVGGATFSANGIGLSSGNVMSQNQNSMMNIMDSQSTVNEQQAMTSAGEARTQRPQDLPQFQAPPQTDFSSNQPGQQGFYNPQIQYQEVPPTYAPRMTTVSPSSNNQLDASLFGTGVAQQQDPTRTSDAAWGLGSSDTNVAFTTGGGKFDTSFQTQSSSSVWKSLASGGKNPLDFAAIVQKPPPAPITTPAPTTTTPIPTTPLPMIDVNDLTPQSVDPVNREVMLSMVKSMATTRESLFTLLYTTGGEFLTSMGIDPIQIKGSVSTAVLNILPELRRVLRLPPRRKYPKTPYIVGYSYSKDANKTNTKSSSAGAPPAAAATSAPATPPPTPDPIQRTIETAMAKQVLTMLGLAPEPPDVPARGQGRGGRGGGGGGGGFGAMDPWGAMDPFGAGGGGGGWGGGGGGGGGGGRGRGGGRRGGRGRQISRAWQEVLGLVPEAAEAGAAGGRGGGGMGGMGGFGGGFGGGGGGRRGGRGGGRRQAAMMDTLIDAFGF